VQQIKTDSDDKLLKGKADIKREIQVMNDSTQDVPSQIKQLKTEILDK
jgi:chaperonin cofactor prefoldin